LSGFPLQTLLIAYTIAPVAAEGYLKKLQRRTMESVSQSFLRALLK